MEDSWLILLGFFTFGFSTGVATTFILIKKFIFDFDASNCKDTCPNKKNGEGVKY